MIRAGLVDYSYRGRQICVVEISFVGHVAQVPPLASLVTPEASEVAFHPLARVLAEPGVLAFPEQLEVLRAYSESATARSVT